jgi:hypothetical protein
MAGGRERAVALIGFGEFALVDKQTPFETVVVHNPAVIGAAPRDCRSPGATRTHHHHVISCFSRISWRRFGRAHTYSHMSVA